VTAPPFVGLTGGIGAGKSEALAATEDAVPGDEPTPEETAAEEAE